MPTILALDSRVGWAFVREGARILLLSPPYRDLTHAPVVSESAVERAVTQHEYYAYSQRCSTMAEAVEWIRARVLDRQKAEGKSYPEPGALGREALKNATPGMIAHVIKRIEDEFLPGGQLDLCEDILQWLLRESSAVAHDSVLSEKVRQLLRHVDQKKSEQAARMKKQIGDNDCFPELQKSGTAMGVTEIERQVRPVQSMFGWAA